MPRKELYVSAYVSMYLIVFFDLPVDSKESRKEYALFRKKLLRDGFHMEQYSVYSRYCPNATSHEKHLKYVRDSLPPKGCVKCMTVTTKMYEKTETYYGKNEEPSKKAPTVYAFY